MFFATPTWLLLLGHRCISASDIQLPLSAETSIEPPPRTSLPTEHPASIQFSAWLTAFNTADEETLLQYHTNSNFPYSVASRDVATIDREVGLARATEGFQIADVESCSEPSTVTAVMKERRKMGRYARAIMHVNVSIETFPATEFQIGPIVTPMKMIPKDDPRRAEFEKALAPLTSKRRRVVVNDVVAVIRDQYVIPELGEQMIEVVERMMKAGEYDGIEGSEAFADRLTQDLHSASHDLHVRVMFSDHPLPLAGQTNEGPHVPEPLFERFSRMNFGFGAIEFDSTTLPGKVIATLTVNSFLPATAEVASDWREIRTKMGLILSDIADADALLLDLRSNGGGDPHTVAFMQSYLLSGPESTHLLDMVNSTSDIQESFFTTPVAELPVGTRPFGGTKPLIVLTSASTASGGEAMAYDMKAFKRSVAIIGEGNERTIGMANPGTIRFVAEEEFGKRWWGLTIPTMKPVHSVTGMNWEGVGVISDVVAGKGGWENVTSAIEVGKKLAIRELKQIN